MKKAASIFFISIFLFNWIGFRLLSSILENSANTALVVSLDNDEYKTEDLISIKLPANLPYYTSSSQSPGWMERLN